MRKLIRKLINWAFNVDDEAWAYDNRVGEEPSVTVYCKAKPSFPGKKTPIPPTSVSPTPSPFVSRKIPIPPGSVAIPRDCAFGSRPETVP